MCERHDSNSNGFPRLSGPIVKWIVWGGPATYVNSDDFEDFSGYAERGRSILTLLALIVTGRVSEDPQQIASLTRRITMSPLLVFCKVTI